MFVSVLCRNNICFSWVNCGGVGGWGLVFFINSACICSVTPFWIQHSCTEHKVAILSLPASCPWHQPRPALGRHCLCFAQSFLLNQGGAGLLWRCQQGCSAAFPWALAPLPSSLQAGGTAWAVTFSLWGSTIRSVTSSWSSTRARTPRWAALAGSGAKGRPAVLQLKAPLPPQAVDIPPELCHGIQGKLTLNDNAVLPDQWVWSLLLLKGLSCTYGSRNGFCAHRE